MVPDDLPERYIAMVEALEERRHSGLFRTLEHFQPEEGDARCRMGDRTLLNFSSNDYLGLAMDPAVREGAALHASRYGGGATASRLVAGGFEIHAKLEAELAAFTRRESALLFNSGYQANISVLPTLVGKGGAIFADRMCHNSILQGALLSRGELRRFRHNDPVHLETLLGEARARAESPVLVVTESIFSMDGDRAPLGEISELAERYGALLMVDDAHALGVWGEEGEGLAAANPRIDVILGTFGKALGSAGSFVSCPENLRSYLINFCSGFIYTTAPAPATVGAAAAALERIRSGDLQLGRYREWIGKAHRRLRESGFDTSPSDTQIIPIRMEGEAAALDCAAYLRERGILAVAIRPPTVPEGSSRLRISLNRLHTDGDLGALIASLSEWRELWTDGDRVTVPANAHPPAPSSAGKRST